MNEWQPSDGDCEWTNGKCSTVATDTNERKECNERRNENWCLNKVRAIWIKLCMIMMCIPLITRMH